MVEQINRYNDVGINDIPRYILFIDFGVKMVR